MRTVLAYAFGGAVSILIFCCVEVVRHTLVFRIGNVILLALALYADWRQSFAQLRGTGRALMRMPVLLVYVWSSLALSDAFDRPNSAIMIAAVLVAFHYGCRWARIRLGSRRGIDVGGANSRDGGTP